MYFIPIFYQAVRLSSVLTTAIAVLPLTLTVAPASAVTGIVCSKRGSFRSAIWSGWLITVIGIGLFQLMRESSSVAVLVALTMFPSVGVGMPFPSMAFAVLAAAAERDAANAAGMYTFFRTLGQTFGVAVGGACFQAVFQNTISVKKIDLADLRLGNRAELSSALISFLRNLDDGPLRTALVDCTQKALDSVWIITCAVAGMALLFSLFTKHYCLNRELETDQGWDHGPQSTARKARPNQ